MYLLFNTFKSHTTQTYVLVPHYLNQASLLSHKHRHVYLQHGANSQTAMNFMNTSFATTKYIWHIRCQNSHTELFETAIRLRRSNRQTRTSPDQNTKKGKKYRTRRTKIRGTTSHNLPSYRIASHSASAQRDGSLKNSQRSA